MKMDLLFAFCAGQLTGIVVLFIVGSIKTFFSNRKIRANEREAIRQFCEERDYCFYGCGRGKEGFYYGGYKCRGDHK